MTLKGSSYTAFTFDTCLLRLISIHVQYTQTESIRLRHFTIRLDSHVTSQLDSHGVVSRKSTSGITNRQKETRFMSIRSNRLESTTFSATLYSPPEVKIREITIHANQLPAFRIDNRGKERIRTESRFAQIDFRHDESTTGATIHIDLIESTRIDNIFNPPCTVHRKSRSVK